jgi:hypothetical protein
MTNQNNHDDECPVCQKRNAGEAHVAECIETHLSQLSVSEPQLPIASPDSSQERLHPIAHNNNQNECPVCQKSFSSNGLDGDREACEVHVAACIDSATSNASQPIVSEKRDPDATPRYLTPSGQDSLLTTFSQPGAYIIAVLNLISFSIPLCLVSLSCSTDNMKKKKLKKKIKKNPTSLIIIIVIIIMADCSVFSPVIRSRRKKRQGKNKPKLTAR